MDREDELLPSLGQVAWTDASRAGTEAIQMGTLSSPISAIAAQIAGEAGVINAPVQLPDRGQLTVKLVPLAMLQKLNDARDDAMLPLTFFVAGIGAEFGLLPSIFAALFNKMTTPDIIMASLAATLLPFLLLTGLLWRRAERRTRSVRKAIFGPEYPR